VTARLTAGHGATAVAINPVTNKIYVANFGDGVNPSTVTVIDGATSSVAATVQVNSKSSVERIRKCRKHSIKGVEYEKASFFRVRSGQSGPSC
jgi:DNA-binding beta-propeller fold protein YncE